MISTYAFMQIAQVSDGDKMFEVTTVGALTVGLLSFLSPCVLPIVPFYVSYFAGSRLNQAQSNENTIISGRARAVASSIFFGLGIITVFVALGASASTLGVLMQDWFDVLRLVAACLLIVMGLHFLGIVQIAVFHRQVRIETRLIDPSKFVGAYVVGLDPLCGASSCRNFIYGCRARYRCRRSAIIICLRSGHDSAVCSRVAICGSIHIMDVAV